MLTRREFLESAALASLATPAKADQPLRIAMITTVYRYLSHGQHIGDRFLVGYPLNGAWHKPNVKMVSLYVDQRPEGDLSQARASLASRYTLPSPKRSAAAEAGWLAMQF